MRSMMYQLTVGLVLAASVLPASAQTNLPAFPGAEGFGAYATGGRYGDVYHVTSLGSSASTPGTFAYGLSTAPTNGRTIVFDVSGYIPVSGNLYLDKSKITIAGQTAPGDGVGIKGGTLWIRTSDTIIRHFRFRNGVSADCLDITSAATNTVMDHCDALFSKDENISSFGSPPENFTFQWSFNAWGLYDHSAGGLWYVNRATSHHSLWAHNHTRDPKALPYGLLDWVNNVTFDYGIGFIMADSTETADYKANVENCYFVCPPGNTRPYALSRAGVDSNGVPNFSLWLTNCLWDKDGDGVLNGYQADWAMVSVNPTNFIKLSNAVPRTAGLPVTQDPPLVAYKKIVSQGGPLRLEANYAGGLRDEVAAELIHSLVSQRKDRFYSVADTGAPNGGYGTLVSSRPPPDTDRDGMPDYWESTLGSNPAADDHTNQVPAGAFLTNSPAGYTLLEEYLHFRATPHAVLEMATAGQPVVHEVDLRSYTSGFTNQLPVVYSISNVSTGSVTLTNGHLARFEPPTHYSGRASFIFTVTDGDGSTWAQPFLMLVSSVPFARDLIWKGDGGSNLWSTNALSFVSAGQTNAVAFRNGDGVTFDDTGDGTPFTQLALELQPFEVIVNNSGLNYTFGSTGSLAGAMALTKSGGAMLTISNANTFSGGTTLDGGRIRFGNKAANGAALGIGPLTLGGAATLELYGGEAGDIDDSGVGTFANAISVAVGEEGTLLAPSRYTLASALSGGGTLNLRVNYVRGDVSGSWSAFTGQVNVTSRSGVSDFRVANTAGFPSARLYLATNVLMYSRAAGGSVIPIGEFTASAGAVVSAGTGGGASEQYDVTWRVGGLGTDATNAASFRGTTKLIKQGTGTWTLAGNSTHTGATTVSNGTLAVTGTFAASPVTVASNAFLRSGTILGGGVLVRPGGNLVPIGTLTISNQLALDAANLHLRLSSSPAGGNDHLRVPGGSLALTNTQHLNFTLTDGVLGPGTYALVDEAASTTSSSLAFTHNLPVGSRQTFALTSPPGQVLLDVTGTTAMLTWRGTNGSSWDTSTTNWSNAGAPDRFWPADAVVFDDSSANGVVSLVGSVQPRSVLVSNVSRAYSFNSGSLDGTTSLIKQGAGTLTLPATNHFSGGTLVNGGTLALGSTAANASALGTNAVTLDGGTLQMYGYGMSSTPSYGTFANELVVNTSGTLRVPPRATIASRLTGGGTLNVVDDYVRADFTGDGSAFTGQINVGPRSGSSEFRIANTFGYGAAAMFLSNGVTAYPTAGTATVEIGELAGATNAVLGPGNGSGTNPTWLVGGKNTSATFAGSIRDAGVTTVIKTGSGTWTLSGSNSFTGGILVTQGTLLVNNPTGSGTGSGAVNVHEGASLGGNGTIAGPVTIQADAALSPGDGIGTLTISNSLKLAVDSITRIELDRALNTHDVVACGSVSYDGALVVTNLGGTLSAGDSFPIFEAGSFAGSFFEILGSPGPLLGWDFNPTNGVLSVVGVEPPPPFQYSANIMFPGYTRAEPLANIPLLVVLGTNISGFAYNQFNAPNAGDLRFTTTNGLTVLNHEVDTWDPAGESRVWVQVPSLTSNTTILASWGNGVLTNPPASTTNGATWSAGYVGVWHLSDASVVDSAAGAHHASVNTAVVTNGLIANAASYNGAGQTTQIPWHSDFNLPSQFEVQGWFKLAAADKTNFCTLTSREVAADLNNRNWWLALRSDGRLWWKSSPSIDVTNNTDLANGAWHHFAAVHDGAAARLYVDGLLAGTDSTPGTASTPTTPVFFGGEDGTARYHKGPLDEMRVSNVARSSNWVWAVYQNIASNSTFISIGAVSGVVTNPPTAPTFDSFAIVGGLPAFTIGGWPGYTYTVEASTNLATWTAVLVTNPVTMPFLWTDTGATNLDRRFYRVGCLP
jgi:autotransporter-associated beta strand protein